MMKRIAIIMMILLLLTGCSFKSNEINPDTTISILYNEREASPFNSEWRILNEYQSLKNIILDVKLGDDSDFEDSIAQHIVSDNPPDIILKCWPDTITEYANSGLLVPISDYEDSMPYYKAYIQKNDLQSEIDKLRLDNGKYYILPGYKRETQVQQWIYREDAFTKNNLKQPETYDELYDSLLILKQKYPDSTPITASWGGAHLFAMMGANYGVASGWSGNRYYSYEDDKWHYAPATTNYKQMYAFLNKCYESGLLDTAIFEQTDEEFMNKIQNGQAFVSVTWISSGLDSWNEKLKENGITNGNWEPLPVLESTAGIKALPPVDKFKKGLVILSHTTEKPYFNNLIQFIDWAVYSDEGNELTTWGVEGLTFEKANNMHQFLPNIITPKNKEGTIDISSEYGFNLMFDLIENEEFEDYKKPDKIVEFLARSEKAGETQKSEPNLIIRENDSEIIAVTEGELTCRPQKLN